MPAYPPKPLSRPDPSKSLDHGLPSPAVTRITVPSPTHTVGEGTHYTHLHLSNSMPGPSSTSHGHPTDSGDSLTAYDDSITPPADDQALNDLWGSLRKQKEKKMARERPKVKSLEDPPANLPTESSSISAVLNPPNVDVPLQEASKTDLGAHNTPPPTLRRQRSITSYRESPDGRTMVASFDLRGVPKENLHVSFQRNRLLVTWVAMEVTEWEEEGGYFMRERHERNYQRTLPLPEGTRFEEITGAMSGRHLLIRYPNSKSFRVENRSVSGGS